MVQSFCEVLRIKIEKENSAFLEFKYNKPKEDHHTWAKYQKLKETDCFKQG